MNREIKPVSTYFLEEVINKNHPNIKEEFAEFKSECPRGFNAELSFRVQLWSMLDTPTKKEYYHLSLIFLKGGRYDVDINSFYKSLTEAIKL